MNYRHRPHVLVLVGTCALLAVFATSTAQVPPGSSSPPSSGNTGGRVQSEKNGQPSSGPADFPIGTATPSKKCGVCHEAIYREFTMGFGSDLQYKAIRYQAPGSDRILGLPRNVSATATLHALAGVDPFPVHGRTFEEEGQSCNVCHFPQAFELLDLEKPDIPKPAGRPKEQELGGLTCASCHLTPDGKIRGPYEIEDAPHETVADPRIQTSAMCAYCHALGKRVIGKQTQTFLEWREDFYKPGLGRQHCQDCHMPRTLRELAEDLDGPIRAVARHLWTGGHSTQRLRTALNLVIVQTEEGKPDLEYHVINIGAGHSVPTGSNRRAVYLKVDVLGGRRKVMATHEWMFAPWYGDRPDDRAFLEEDKRRQDAVAAMQADAQGPHEAPIRAGEERILTWVPKLKPGKYIIRAKLIYDLNRYNDRTFVEDLTEIYRASLSIKVNAAN